jgi:FMN-dependent NADH-azoreductase
MKLLHIDSSISGEQSVSRQLTASIVAQLKHTTPALEITYRDLVAAPVPHHSPVLWERKLQASSEDRTLNTGAIPLQGTFAPDDHATALQIEQDFATINAVLHEFLATDIIVLGAPMYNFAIPSQLKAWIDCLSVPGQTFRYTSQGAEGLCTDKRIIIASSRGGIYASPSPLASLDHQESYLTTFFNFIGVSDITFVRVEGVNMGGEQRQRSLSAALAEVATLRAA